MNEQKETKELTIDLKLIGEIGLNKEFLTQKEDLNKTFNLILTFFSHSEENIRIQASETLGKICIQN